MPPERRSSKALFALSNTATLLLLGLLFFFLFPSATTPALAVSPDYELRLVQVLHRHGARTPLVTFNQSAICGDEFACGDLNRPGQTMLKNVGAFLRERYTKDAAVVDPAAPFLTSDAYNLTVSYSRSTDILRTLQSSVALLRGMFPDMDAYYPAVHTNNRNTDSLLLSDVVPSVRAKQRYGQPELEAVCRPVVDRRFPQAQDLLEMAREVHAEGLCADPANRLKCALTLCDIGLAYEPTGELQKLTKLKKSLEEVCTAVECAVRFYLGFNGSDPVQEKQGSVGQELAQAMILNMKAAISPAEGAVDYKFYQYSAHDSTVTPLAVTFGDNSAGAMLPPFAATFIVELLAKKKGRRGGDRKARRQDEDAAYDYFVRVLLGSPGLTPDTAYTFALTKFEMQCLSAQGKTYKAEGNVCPLEDFIRLVDASRPRSAAGTCYLDPVYAERMKCPLTGPLPKKRRRLAGGDLSDDCLQFRKACPAFACPPGHHLSAVDFGCYETRRGGGGATPAGGGGGAAVVAVGAVAFFLGGLVGLGLLLVRRLCERGRRRGGYTMPVGVAP